MRAQTKQTILAKAALLLAALIWGSSFVIMKTTIDNMAPCYLLAFRFLVAALLLAAIFHKRFHFLSLDYLKKSAILGLFLFGGYSVQTYGLMFTTPGKNAFLTTTYCILVPFLYWIVDKNKPDAYNIISAFTCVFGIAFISLSESLTIGQGDLLSIGCGFLYAAHVVFISKFNKTRDAILLTILQFGFAGIYALVAALLFEVPPATFQLNTFPSLLYLAVFATAIALGLQNIGQKYTHPAAASILLSLESVFGIMFSIVLYGEKLTPKLAIGFVLIFGSVLLSETKPNLRKRALVQGEEAV